MAAISQRMERYVSRSRKLKSSLPFLYVSSGHLLPDLNVFALIRSTYSLSLFLQVNFSRVEKFIEYIGSFEDTIFQKRARIHQVNILV